MDGSVTECRTVDEQKQIILMAAPVMTQKRDAQLIGLTEGRAGKGLDRKGPSGVHQDWPRSHGEHCRPVSTGADQEGCQ